MLKAVANVNYVVASALIGMEVTHQSELDAALLDLDGTPDKSRLALIW